ncbi:MAG: hypothetical protein LBL95_07235 [Deltaproteobacteria bacterium]|nr:hypothetical protein [Deltaproteobacteria bacterium]
MAEQFKSALDILDKESPDPSEVRGLMDELKTLTATVKKEMDKGLTPADSVPAQGLLRACQTAEEAVRNFPPARKPGKGGER